MNQTIAAILVSVLPAFSAMAGQLDRFEEQAGRKDPAPNQQSNRRNRTSSLNDPFGSGTYPTQNHGEGFLESFWMWMVASPFGYRPDDPGASMLSPGSAAAQEWSAENQWSRWHQPGLATLPYVRVDAAWQYINADLDAVDVRLEGGYKVLAIHARHTHYMERHPSDQLDINQLYGVFRLGGNGLGGEKQISGWEIGVGAGVVQQHGNRDYTSGAFTLPIKIHPTDWLGFEFRPAWYRPQEHTINDFDFSVSAGRRYVQFRSGYRWLWMHGDGTWLNGPYAGLSVSF